MAINLAIIEKSLEEMNQQTNQLLDLVRALQKGKLFNEPLSATIKNNLTNQAKTRWLTIKTTYDALTQEINS